MKLSERFRQIESSLPPDWESVSLRLTTEQPSDLARAAQVMGPMGVGWVGDELVLAVRRAGGASGAEAARRLFERLDTSRVWCELEVGPVAVAGPAEQGAVRAPAVASWDAALAALPADWTDALCELEIESSALLPRTALLCAPLNPYRGKNAVAFTFRVAGRAGYGAAPGMVRRCLERLDEEGIVARVRVVRHLADTGLVATQGPVWRVAGRSL